MSNTTTTAYHDASVMYATTDFSKLSWLELQWASWYLWIGNPVLATGLASFLLHEVCGFCSFVWLSSSRLHGRSYTSAGRSHGSLSTLCPTSASGSFNQTRSLLPVNNGPAPSRFSSATSPLSSPLSGSSTPWQNSLACRPGRYLSLRGRPSHLKCSSSSFSRTCSTTSVR